MNLAAAIYDGQRAALVEEADGRRFDDYEGAGVCAPPNRHRTKVVYAHRSMPSTATVDVDQSQQRRFDAIDRPILNVPSSFIVSILCGRRAVQTRFGRCRFARNLDLIDKG